ncbi:hypothetical protein Pint_15043 [Pistacia integerrima]|uniref:Uncharacterized protein n=1 Tax=Pistacia integerrima TaxID=434235 RepID=A0ACC0ZBN8_9ROSI|nr:hypothetical protein Pint_15043 [Pistacia integerrima]
MQSRGSSNRLSNSAFESRVAGLMLAMFASMATIYVASRLWQDAENREYLVNELDKRIGLNQSAVSVDDTLRIISCREQRKKLSALQMELAEARKEGFVSNHLPQKEDKNSKKRLLAVIGIITTFGRKKNRDAIRKAWMPTGNFPCFFAVSFFFIVIPFLFKLLRYTFITCATLEKLEVEKGIIVRFVVGRSANRGNVSDREIDDENRQNNDFIVLDGQVETPEERSRKIKSFFVHAVENWDAEFYAKVNDDVYVNIDALGAMLSLHLGEPRVYIGCMKSGKVFSEPTNQWYEPDWWKFGDGKGYATILVVYEVRKIFVVHHLPLRIALLRVILGGDIQCVHIDDFKFWFIADREALGMAGYLFFKHMHMMISVLDHGLLGLMCRMLMTGSFAAMPGHQEPYVQLCDLPCQLTCNIAGIFTEAILLSVMLNACLRLNEEYSIDTCQKSISGTSLDFLFKRIL